MMIQAALRECSSKKLAIFSELFRRSDIGALRLAPNTPYLNQQRIYTVIRRLEQSEPN